MTEALNRAVSEALKEHISLSKTRLETMVWLISGSICHGTSCLWRLSASTPSLAKKDSIERRFRRFFADVNIDEAEVARLVVQSMNLSRKPWTVIIDRTEWELGKTTVNVLMLGVLKNVNCVPLLWDVVQKRGASSMQQRIDLFDRLLRIFPDQRIAWVIGDREFIGAEWIKWLNENGIGFFLRLRNNFHVSNDGRTTHRVCDLAMHLKPGKRMSLPGEWRLGVHGQMNGALARIAIMRLKSGELLVVATNAGVRKALSRYRDRWTIETMFGCLKTRGFDLQATHMVEPARLAKLLSVLAIAACMAFKMGYWSHQRRPILNKAHGRPAQSIFARGLAMLRKNIMLAEPDAIERMILWLFRPRQPTPIQLKGITL